MEKKALFLTVHDLGTNRKWRAEIFCFDLFPVAGVCMKSSSLPAIDLHFFFLQNVAFFLRSVCWTRNLLSLSLSQVYIRNNIIQLGLTSRTKLMFIGERKGIGGRERDRVVRSNLSQLPLTSLPYRSVGRLHFPLLRPLVCGALVFVCCVQLTSTCLLSAAVENWDTIPNRPALRCVIVGYQKMGCTLADIKFLSRGFTSFCLTKYLLHLNMHNSTCYQVDIHANK